MLADDYLAVGIFAVIALLFPILTLFIGRYFRPSMKTPLKHTTYECGEPPVGEAMIQFHFQYYMFAIIFLVFDIVAIFVLLGALVYYELAWEARGFLGAFVALLLFGLYYVLGKEDVIWI